MALNKKSQDAEVVKEAEQDVQAKTQEAIQQESGAVLEPEPEPAAAALPAVVEKETQLTTPRSGAIGVNPEIANALAEQGFAGLVFDYHSFANIKLQSEFEGPDNLILPSDGFYVQVTGNRYKWAATSLHANDKEREAEFVYDKLEMNNPNSKVALAVQKWKEQGVGWVWKDYMDVFVTMLHDGLPEDKSLVGQFCVLSLPTTALGKFNALLVSLTAKYKPLPIRDLVIKVSRGDKIMNAAKPYYPWKFQFEAKLADWTAPE